MRELVDERPGARAASGAALGLLIALIVLALVGGLLGDVPDPGLIIGFGVIGSVFGALAWGLIDDERRRHAAAAAVDLAAEPPRPDSRGLT